MELVQRAVQAHIPFRAVVADSFYGEDRGFKRGLRDLKVGYMLALKPSHDGRASRSGDRLIPGGRGGKGNGRVLSDRESRVKVTRTFRDGSQQDWWALELDIRPYGPQKQERVVIATTDPATLPDLTTSAPFDQSADTGITAGSGQRTDSSQPPGSGALVRAKSLFVKVR